MLCATKLLYRILQQLHSLLIRTIPIALQINQPPTVVIAIPPGGSAVGGDDGFAALEGFGDDKTEVLGESREDEDVAPVPDFLELIAKGGRNYF